MPQRRVVVVGSVNVDLSARVAGLPRPGETVLASGFVVVAGGKGANQAVAAARLGAAVALVGCRGDDAHGELAERSLRDAGVDVGALRRVPGPTGTALIAVDDAGENTIVVVTGANAHLAAAQVREAAAGWGPGTVVGVQLEVPQEAVDAAVAGAAGAGARLVVNAAPARPLPESVLRAADPLVVNETEADVYLGEPGRAVADPRGAVVGLLRLGPRSVVLTAGPDGAYLADGVADVRHVPGVVAEVVDTTGAGDAFVGAVLDALARDLPLAEAVGAAVRVGAYAVGRRGAQASYPAARDLAAAPGRAGCPEAEAPDARRA